GIAALLLAGIGWRWLQPAAPQPTSDVVAAAPAASALQIAVAPPPPPPAPAPSETETTRVPGLACTAAAADWACVLDGLARLSTAPQGVKLRIEPARLKVGDF